MISCPKKHPDRNQAFTLMELSMTLVLMGFIAVAVLKFTQANDDTQCYSTAKKQTQDIKEAINRFAMKNDRYPMPAIRTIGMNDVSYGREATPAQISANLIDQIDGASFGALPFQALGIPIDNASDCWGNKLTYAVTTALTAPTGFLDANTVGKLTIKTDNTVVFMQEAGFAVISHGTDQLGAVKSNYSGVDKKWCTADGTLKTQNCDITNTDLISAEFNDGKASPNNYFDDVIVYRGKPWRTDVSSNLYCWGRDRNGRLGINGSGVDVPKPTMTEGGITFSSVAVGARHTCGLSSTGKAYCWGVNDYGQLGIGSLTADKRVPVPVVGPGGTLASALTFSSITVADQHTCAVEKTSGHAYCWGAAGNLFILGNPSGADYTRPQQVRGPDGALASAISFKQLSANYQHTCGIRTSDGRPYCWGYPLGPYAPGCYTSPGFQPIPPADSYMPKPAPGPDGTTGTQYAFKTLYSDAQLTICGLDFYDKAYCMGSNTYGELGNGGTMAAGTCTTVFSEVLSPTGTSPGYDFTSLSVGFPYRCGIKNDKAYCWGYNASGALGRNSVDTSPNLYNNKLPPTDPVVGTDGTVGNALDFREIATWQGHTCALTPAGKAHCWGSNNRRQLGSLSAVDPLPRPQKVVGPDGTEASALDYRIIKNGGEYSCAILGTPDPVVIIPPPVPVPVNGVCNYANGGCTTGNRTGQVFGPGTVTWNCIGLNGGTDDMGCTGNLGVCALNSPTIHCLAGDAQYTGNTLCVSPGQAVYPYTCECITPPCVGSPDSCQTAPFNDLSCP